MRFDVIPKDQHAIDIEACFEGRIRSAAPPPHCGTLTLVCFTNRCGSTLICSALSRLGLAGPPNQDLNFEYFNAKAVMAHASAQALSSLDDYVDFCLKSYSSAEGHFTTKLSVQQFNFLLESGIFERLAVRPNIIWARRRNVIAQAVSLVTAVQDKAWTSLHEPAASGVEFNEPRILNAAKAIYERNAWFEFLFDYHELAPVEIVYEDFAANEEQLVDHLARRYGLEAGTRRPSLLPVRMQSVAHKSDWEERIRSAGRKAIRG